MKTSLTRIAIRRPVTVLMLTLTLIGAGVVALNRIPIEFLPRFESPFIAVVIPYPGATPAQVEQEVAIPAEGRFRTVPNLEWIRTTSDSNACVAHLLFEQTADMNLATAEVRDRIERLKLELPQGVDRMMVQHMNQNALPVMVFLVTGEGDEYEVTNLVRTTFRNRIMRVDGVANVEVMAKPEQQVLIEFDQDVLRSRGISLYQTIAALQQASINASVGELEEGDTKYFVRVDEEFSRLSDVANTVVAPGGVRLDDIAKVYYGAREIDQDYNLDGRGGAVVLVMKESKANTVDVCKAVHRETEALLAEHADEGIHVFSVFDQSDYILGALDSLLKAGKYGSLLALAVLFLFLLRVRATVIVAVAIPLSIVSGFVFMFFSEMTLNLITMVSLIIAIGMLVDNAIVVVENIMRYQQLGLDPKESARRGASEVALAITSATLTTIVVFVPVFYVSTGQMREWMLQFALPITVSLLASLLIALTLIPLAISYLRPSGSHKLPATAPQALRRFGRWASSTWLVRLAAYFRRAHPLDHIRGAYGRALSGALRWRFGAALLVIAFVAYSAAVPMRKMAKGTEPEMDQRQVIMRVEMDQNYDLDMARDLMGRLRRQIDQWRDELGIKHIMLHHSASEGTLQVFLKETEELPPGASVPYETDEVLDILWMRLPHRVPGAEVKFEVAQAAQGEGAKVALRMLGDDIDTLRRYADDLRYRLSQLPTISDVETDAERERKEIQLGVDEPLAETAGVNPFVIAQTVDFALRGVRLPYLKQGGKEIEVWAQFAEEFRKTRGNLENVSVQNAQGDLVSLDHLVDMSKAQSPQRIQRWNGKNVINVTAKANTPNLMLIRSQIAQVLAGFELPAGYQVGFGEEFVEQEKSIAELVTTLLLAIALIYIVMSALFESFTLPLSILTTVFMAFAGAFWALYLTDTPFEVVTGIGLVLMTGIIVNNGIVIIDHINQLRKQEPDRHRAIVQAGKDRFRPVLMTALTTILGCVPLALEPEPGKQQVFLGLGRALIGGLTLGTVLTLFVVPLAYTFLDDFGLFLRSFFSHFGLTRRLLIGRAR